MLQAKESAVDRIKKLDAERAKIFEEAKNEALIPPHKISDSRDSGSRVAVIHGNPPTR